MSPVANEKVTVRLLFLGAAGVGKTALIQRFLQDRFEPRHKRTVEELHSIEHDTEGSKVRIEIMDTSGSYSFPAMRRLCIRNSDAFALVYTVDDAESFEEVQRLRDEILEIKEDKFVPITVVGNKMDLEKQRQVAYGDTMAIVELDWHACFVETSAKSGMNVTRLFRELLQQVNFPSCLTPALQRRRDSVPKVSLCKKPDMKKTNSCSIS